MFHVVQHSVHPIFFVIELVSLIKGKPVEKQGRKASGLKREGCAMPAGLPVLYRRHSDWLLVLL